jgi:hypothetical protein
MKKLFIFLIVAALLVGGYFFFTDKNSADITVACTAEAKQCPDGTYVGRTGPQCEFAACPGTSTNPAQPIPTAAIHIGSAFSVPGVTITPLAVTADSRCATDVQCIQAGTVTIKADVSVQGTKSTEEFTLGKPATVGTAVITLTAVTPAKVSTHTISSEEYAFVFSVSVK